MSNKASKGKHRSSDDSDRTQTADEDPRHLFTHHRPVLDSPTSAQADEDQSGPSLLPQEAATPSETQSAAEAPAASTAVTAVDPAAKAVSETLPTADQAAAVAAVANTEGSPQAAAPGADHLPTKKVVNDAVKEAEHQREAEKYIDSHEYFVPIKHTARHRSIMVSIILVVVLFILALVLVDLMLDSGIILLIQKIPHTHFFTNGN